jgi:Family of unknown function (DUF6186)
VIDRHTTLVVWGVLAASLIAVQGAAVLSRGRLPGLGGLVGRVAGHGAGRWIFLVAWMWLGWHAFAR